MKKTSFIIASVLLLASSGVAYADTSSTALVVTASNATAGNQLMVYDTAGDLLQTLPTQGQGGVGGNAGGIAVQGSMVAVVNFTSQSVSIFNRTGTGLAFVEQFSSASKPVSVAFGNGHLYVLGNTTVESHKISGTSIDPTADGTATLLKADNSAAQVGALPTELVISEKSNTIETVSLQHGAVSGSASAIGIPAGSNTPFGLVTRGENAYVTIAHSDEIATIQNDQVTDITSSGTQHAPCWLALSGDYLYSSNSPSMSLSLYRVMGNKMVLDTEVAAALTGAPTDIASDDHALAVIDGSDHLSIFKIGAQGVLSPVSSTNTGVATNGVGIVE